MQYFQTEPGAVLSFTGEDHQDFLQGQGTADLRGDPGFCRYSLWLDFKGNIVADGHVLKLDESRMLLVSDKTPADALIEKFDRHIIADDVTIEDETDSWDILSVAPIDVHKAHEMKALTIPGEGLFCILEDGISFTGRRLGKGTLQALLKRGSKLMELDSMVPEDAEMLRISAAYPLIPDDCDDGSLNPMEANIISPLSMIKGCYLGQEVVARVYRLNRTARRLVKFHDADFPFKKGGNLHLSGKVVGKLTSVVENGDNSCAIGWLKSKLEDGRINLDEGELSVESLPSS